MESKKVILRSPGRKKVDIDLSLAIKQYECGRSLRWIGEYFGISGTTIFYYFKAYNLAIKAGFSDPVTAVEKGYVTRFGVKQEAKKNQNKTIS